MVGFDNGICIWFEVLEEFDMLIVKRMFFVKSVWELMRLFLMSFFFVIFDGYWVWMFEGEFFFFVICFLLSGFWLEFCIDYRMLCIEYFIFWIL